MTKYDIIIFGATGFTGVLVAEYFAKHLHPATGKLRWAIAGRNFHMLDRLKDCLVMINNSCRNVDILVADLANKDSLDQMARSATVVLNLVGPYGLYGEPVVQACIAAGTHYFDLTGEVQFVRAMREKYHEQAKKAGVFICHSAGFDCVPSDIGTLHGLQEARNLPGSQRIRLVDCFVELDGRFSSGTFKSGIDSVSKLSVLSDVPNMVNTVYNEQADSILSTVALAVKHFVRSLTTTSVKWYPHFNWTLKRFVFPFPAVDTTIARYSAQEMPGLYGSEFQFGYYFMPSLLVGALLFFLLPFLAPLLLLAVLLLKVPVFKSLVLSLIPDGPNGPDVERRAKSWFKQTFIMRDSLGEVRVRGEVSGGCPGYGETSKMMALCGVALVDLVKNKQTAVPGLRGGVLSPAAVVGTSVVPYLQEAGMVVKSEVTRRKYS